MLLLWIIGKNMTRYFESKNKLVYKLNYNCCDFVSQIVTSFIFINEPQSGCQEGFPLVIYAKPTGMFGNMMLVMQLCIPCHGDGA